MTANTEFLRAAAERLRQPDFTPPEGLLDALADWLDGEAAVIGELPNLVNVVAAVIENKSGPIGRISVGATEQGEMSAQAESTPAALRLADLILEGGRAVL